MHTTFNNLLYSRMAEARNFRKCLRNRSERHCSCHVTCTCDASCRWILEQGWGLWRGGLHQGRLWTALRLHRVFLPSRHTPHPPGAPALVATRWSLQSCVAGRIETEARNLAWNSKLIDVTQYVRVNCPNKKVTASHFFQSSFSTHLSYLRYTLMRSPNMHECSWSILFRWRRTRTWRQVGKTWVGCLCYRQTISSIPVELLKMCCISSSRCSLFPYSILWDHVWSSA